LKYTGFFFGALLLFVVLAFFWVGGTQSGAQWLVAQSKPWIPGKLDIGTIQGNLLGQLELRNVHYQDNGLDVQADKALIHWFPGQLWSSTAWVKQLYIEDARIQLPPPADAPPTEEPPSVPDIQLPLDIVLEDIQLKNIEIISAQGEPIPIALVQLQAEVREYATISKFHIVSPLVEASAKGTAKLVAPHPVDLDIGWSTNLPDIGALSGNAKLQGDTNKLKLKHTLKQPAVTELDATVEDVLGAGNWQLTLDWVALQWPLDASQPAIASSQNGKLTGKGDLSSYQVTLITALDGEQIPLGEWVLDVAGDLTKADITKLQGSLLEGTLSATGQVGWQQGVSGQIDLAIEGFNLTKVLPEWPAGFLMNTQLQAAFAGESVDVKQLQIDIQGSAQPSQFTVQGKVNLADDLPVLETAVTWQNLTWPLEGTPVAQSQQGNANITGKPDDWQAVADMHLAGQDIPEGQWQVEANGSDTQAHLAGVTAQILNGTLELTGDVAWLPHASWALDINGAQLNPGEKWRDWPGALSLSLVSQGSLQGEILDATAKITKVEGKLRGYPLQAQADITAKDDVYSVSNFLLQSGSTLITAKGKLGETLSADWKIDASDLNTLHPSAGGALQGEGQLSGTFEAPQISATLNGEAIRFEYYVLTSLNADVAASLEANAPLNVQINVEELKNDNELLLNTLQVNGKGQLGTHHLALEAKLPTETLGVKLDGGFDPELNTWEGLLSELNLTSQKFGTWTLDRASSLLASPTKIELAESCLRRDTAAICLQASQEEAQQRLQAEIAGLPFAFAKPFLPEDIDIKGQLEGSIDASLMADGELRAESILTVAPGELTTVLDDELQTFTFKGGELRGFITDAGLAVGLGFELLENSIIQGALTLPGMTRWPVDEEQPLQASMNLDFQDLAIFPGLLTQSGNFQGEADLSINVAGTVTQPEVQGQLRVQEADLSLPDFGLHLKDLNTQVDLKDSAVTLLASAQSGEGQLQINGDADISNFERWRTKVTIQGEQFAVMNTPEFQVTLSPDMTINAMPGIVDAQGSLTIPTALLAPNIVTVLSAGGDAAPTAIRASNDAVFVDESTDNESVEDEFAWSITGENRIVFGDNVRVDVIGFKSKIEGELDLINRANQLLPIASGSLRLLEGEYKAYGQDLEIDEGLVIFSDRPIDNPGLNIKAIRRIRNDTNNPRVTEAGIRITGTARTPKLVLFSEPMVEDRDILSYIVTGSTFGGGDLSSSKLGLGTYVTEKLYVGFGFSP
ncbi:MAG: translocation/assembly module TamB domain-containing protein, partial [Pseudomonadota bacterium]